MSIFEYRALQNDGTIAEGNLEASGRQEAYRQLEGRGLKPVGLSETNIERTGANSEFRLKWKSQRVSSAALENFTRQLSN